VPSAQRHVKEFWAKRRKGERKMKKAVSMMLFAMLIFSIVLIAAPIAKCEDGEEDPFTYTYNVVKDPDFAWVGELKPGESTDWVEVTVGINGSATYSVTQIGGWTGAPSGWSIEANPGPPYTWSSSGSTVTVKIRVTVSSTETVGCWTFNVKLAPGKDSSGRTIGSGDGVHFKVCVTIPPPAPPAATISGVKFHDVNANGIRDIGEEGLEGWTIQLWKDGTCVQTKTTDSAGDYIFTVTEVGHYKVTEVLKSGWMQTAPADGYYEFDVALGAEITGLDFGNIKLGSISGAKFYDANVNGVWDSGEPPIEGWKAHLTGTNIRCDTIDVYAFTGADGKFVFKDLLPGTYTVEEVFPSGMWISTTATSFSHELEEGENYVGPYFGNVCLMPGTGGKTLGFWSNKNGQALITPSDLTELNALNLYKPKGWVYPPFTDKTQIKSYLLNATAVDMRWMLSAQLIATKLNVLHGFLSGSTMVYVGPSIYVDSGFISIDDIMANANTALLSGTRAEQEYWKNLLDGLNNNWLPFVCSGPCYPIVYP
jgi:hypothetical protein